MSVASSASRVFGLALRLGDAHQLRDGAERLADPIRAAMRRPEQLIGLRVVADQQAVDAFPCRGILQAAPERYEPVIRSAQREAVTGNQPYLAAHGLVLKPGRRRRHDAVPLVRVQAHERRLVLAFLCHGIDAERRAHRAGLLVVRPLDARVGREGVGDGEEVADRGLAIVRQAGHREIAGRRRQVQHRLRRPAPVPGGTRGCEYRVRMTVHRERGDTTVVSSVLRVGEDLRRGGKAESHVAPAAFVVAEGAAVQHGDLERLVCGGRHADLGEPV